MRPAAPSPARPCVFPPTVASPHPPSSFLHDARPPPPRRRPHARAASYGDNEDPYPSLSDYHDYEPNLEFDDTELQSASSVTGKMTTTTRRRRQPPGAPPLVSARLLAATTSTPPCVLHCLPACLPGWLLLPSPARGSRCMIRSHPPRSAWWLVVCMADFTHAITSATCTHASVRHKHVSACTAWRPAPPASSLALVCSLTFTNTGFLVGLDLPAPLLEPPSHPPCMIWA